ncbi:MAG: hypothetical protein ABI690_08925 [Chloroflexota bacterium]
MEKITVAWFDDTKNAILCTYNQEGWTWDDFYLALQQQKALIETVDHPKVHIIVDVRKSTWLPKGGSLLTGLKKTTHDHHPRQGEIIIVGARGMVASIASTISNLMTSSRMEMHFAAKMEEVPALLNQLETARP